MNRFKFRIWSPEDKKFYYNAAISIASGSINQLTGIESIDNKFNISTLKKYVIQQTTGCLDKNGVEIFEGDIVQFIGGELYIVEYTEAYSGYQFCLIDNSGALSDFYGGVPNSIVSVIGNIFENKDLMKILE